MRGQVLGLLVEITVGSGPDHDSGFHPATLAGLCLSRSSFRLRTQ